MVHNNVKSNDDNKIMAVSTYDLSKDFSNQAHAVANIDIEIRQGEFFSLLGPSGCGKSTLLRMIAGLEKPTSGRVMISGIDVTQIEPRRRKIAMVFQDYALFPSMNVSDNISYSLRIRGESKDVRQSYAKRFAKLLDLMPMLERRPAQLSGGQQQRVALARSMAAEPDVLLLDEPLSNLDARLRLSARTMLKCFQQETGLTTIFVTHDQSEALALSDRMAVMRDGSIQQVGTPSEIYNRPSNSFVARFIGMIPMNMMQAKVKHLQDSRWTLVVPGGEFTTANDLAAELIDRSAVTVGIRPEYMNWSVETPSQSNFAVQAKVTVSENAGASAVLHCLPIDMTDGSHESDVMDSSLLSIAVPAEDVPETGSLGWLTCSPDRILLFDSRTTEILNHR